MLLIENRQPADALRSALLLFIPKEDREDLPPQEVWVGKWAEEADALRHAHLSKIPALLKDASHEAQAIEAAVRLADFRRIAFCFNSAEAYRPSEEIKESDERRFVLGKGFPPPGPIFCGTGKNNPNHSEHSFGRALRRARAFAASGCSLAIYALAAVEKICREHPDREMFLPEETPAVKKKSIFQAFCTSTASRAALMQRVRKHPIAFCG